MLVLWLIIVKLMCRHHYVREDKVLEVPVFQSLSLSVSQTLRLSDSQTLSLSDSLSLILSVSQTLSLSVSQSLRLSDCQTLSLSVKVGEGFLERLFYLLFQESLALLALSKSSAAMSDSSEL